MHNVQGTNVVSLFLQTTELVSTKFGRKHLWGMRIEVCENQGAGIYWGPIRGKKV